jgi:hypothetical protein|eukprot:3134825-Prymnesium_polylepis.1
MRFAFLAGTLASVAAFGAPAASTTCPTSPGADSYRDVFFVEVWTVTPGATLAANAAIEATMQGATVYTQNYVQYPDGSGLAVPESTPGDNGNMNYEWFVVYDSAGIITHGKVIHRYKHNGTPFQPMGPTGPTFIGAAYNILMRHIVPDVEYWWAAVQVPAQVNLSETATKAIRNSVAYGTPMFGASSQEWYNALGFAPMLESMGFSSFLKGNTAFGFFNCDTKGKNGNADFMYDVVHFTITPTPSASVNNMFATYATALAGTQYNRGGIADDTPGTMGYEFFMEVDTNGYYTGGSILGSYTSYSSFMNANKWQASEFASLVTITSIETYNPPADKTTANLYADGKYWGASAAAITNWGVRYSGYPVCGF